MLTPAKNTPGEMVALRGYFAGPGLLAFVVFAMPLKPLADVVGNYTCCERHQKTEQNVHLLTSFLCRYEEGSKVSIPYFDKFRNPMNRGNANEEALCYKGSA